MIYGGFFLFRLMFMFVPLMMFGIIGYRMYTIFNKSKSNSRAPQLTVEAQVVSRRTQGYYSKDDNIDGGTTRYYCDL